MESETGLGVFLVNFNFHHVRIEYSLSVDHRLGGPG